MHSFFYDLRRASHTSQNEARWSLSAVHDEVNGPAPSLIHFRQNSTPKMLSPSIFLLLVTGSVKSFSFVKNPTRSIWTDFSLGLSNRGEDQGNKKPLTAADILSRARKAAGVASNEEEEDTGPVLLFDEPLLQDMRKTLLTLEKRIKNGPGSLNMEEIKELQAASSRIINDMKSYRPTVADVAVEKKAQPSKAPLTASAMPLKRESDSEDIFSPYTVSPHFSKQSPYEQPEESDAHALVDSVMKKASETDDDNESEDGPKYNGRGGFGMAAGTRNTYFIPGMDEMSPEEYREALQKSVSDRQALRKQRGMVGNVSSQSYLDQLGNR